MTALLATGSAVGLYVSPVILAIPPPYGEYALADFDYALVKADNSMILYDLNAGPSATPLGAYEAWGTGFWQGTLLFPLTILP